MLRGADFRLRFNRKRLSSRKSANRDQQFSKIDALRNAFLRRGQPVISVDAKKRELVGMFKNVGRSWRRTPKDVNTYDFRSDAKGVAIPYGVYDVGRKDGFVVVGTSHNTAAFAGGAIGRWWTHAGREAYPAAQEVLILADGGSSNGIRVRGWKAAIQRLANLSGLRVTVAHYPPGASKWNPVEHRLFSAISLAWAGEPLVDYSAIKNLIRSARTPSGARCRVHVDRRHWPTQKETKALSHKAVTDPPAESPLKIRHSRILPSMNYTIEPISMRAE
jgi:hypothetical protein